MRTYTKRRRARSEAATRLRIVEALIRLHRTKGPARTTVTDVAREAGVQRLTVYRHFPDERAMFTACSGHWEASHPPPDPADWAADDEPARRLRTALAALYAFYADGADLYERVFRDLPDVAELAWWAEGWEAWIDDVRRGLARGWRVRRGDRPALRAALAVAVDFWTFRTLTGSGLSPTAAAATSARMVASAFPPAPRRRS